MSAITSRPTGHMSTSSSDSFLSARVHNARRAVDHQRRSPSASTHQFLDAVPEDSDAIMKRLPPSAYRSASSSDMRHSSRKGKARDTQAHRADSAESKRRQRADWVIDLMEVTRGLERWSERERVILVIGNPTADSLAPILFNPAFSDTLLLVGSAEPLPSIEALTSPSFLMQNSHQPVFPTLQPFNLPFSSAPGSHTLPALIEEATALATQFRTRSTSKPRAPSRRGSADSGASTPPLTPPSRSSLGDPLGRRSTDSAEGTALSRPSTMMDLVKSPSETSIPSRAARSKLSSMNLSRETIFGSLRKGDADVKPWLGGSPIDAVVNFVPSASNFVPQRAMQDMLHQAVVSTTGVLPILARRPVKPVSEVQPQITLLHVLPSQVPGPLPGVMESFLLSLLPNFASRTDRDISATVITSPVWLATPRSISNNETHSGSEILLFGGVRSTASQSEIEPQKIRAFLPNWNACSMLTSASSTQNPSRRPVPLSAYSDPPSIGYAAVDARTPPTVNDKPLPTGYPPHSRAAYRQTDFTPSTPELDPSGSSCSSTSGIGEPNVCSEDDHSAAAADRKKKSLVSWLKSKRGRK